MRVFHGKNQFVTQQTRISSLTLIPRDPPFLVAPVLPLESRLRRSVRFASSPAADIQIVPVKCPGE